jgi:hypothetical protein
MKTKLKTKSFSKIKSTTKWLKKQGRGVRGDYLLSFNILRPIHKATVELIDPTVGIRAVVARVCNLFVHEYVEESREHCRCCTFSIL